MVRRAHVGQRDFQPFEERVARGCAFSDVSKAKVRAFTEEAGVAIGRTSAADFLRSLKVADEVRVKNAGILFFAKDVFNWFSNNFFDFVPRNFFKSYISF